MNAPRSTDTGALLPGTRGLVSALCTLAACVALSACGGSSPSSTRTATPPGGSAAASGQGSKQETETLKFKQCMREHGVNLPDKDLGGAPSAIKGIPLATVQAALSACGKYQAASAAASPAQQSELREGFVKYARCLRAAGLNVPEPTGTDLTALASFRQAIAELEGNPSFQQANGKCRSQLPKGR